MLRTTNSRHLLYWAAALAISAAMIHTIVIPVHLEEWWGYGAFFVIAAAAQTTLGFLLFVQAWGYGGMMARERDDEESASHFMRLNCVAGIAGNAAIIALWMVTRTVGIPFFGPHAGDVEEITGIDLVSKVLEAALIAFLVVLARQTPVTTSRTEAARDG